MINAFVSISVRLPAELGRYHNQGGIQQAFLTQVRQQGRQAAIKLIGVG
jgi:hypothetical protein